MLEWESVILQIAGNKKGHRSVLFMSK